MNIHCMHCGHTIELGESYDAYEGPLRCSVCKRLMKVRVESGRLRAMEAFPEAPPPGPDTRAALNHHPAAAASAAAAPRE